MKRKLFVIPLIVLVVLGALYMVSSAGFFSAEVVFPKSPGIFTTSGLEIQRHPLEVRGDYLIGLSGKKAVSIIEVAEGKGSSFIYFMGDTLVPGKIFLSRLEQEQSRQDFFVPSQQEADIPFSIYLDYQGHNKQMHMIEVKGILPPGYYAFHYGQLIRGTSHSNIGFNVAFDFVVAEKALVEEYRRARGAGEKFWKLALAKDSRWKDMFPDGTKKQIPQDFDLLVRLTYDVQNPSLTTGKRFYNREELNFTFEFLPEIARPVDILGKKIVTPFILNVRGGINKSFPLAIEWQGEKVYNPLQEI